VTTFGQELNTDQISDELRDETKNTFRQSLKSLLFRQY